MDNQIINILKSNKRFELYYGSGETIELSNDDFSLDYDGWITVPDKNNVKHIKIESIYKIICLPEKEYVYATIPKSKEIKEQIFDILSDGEEYRTRDIKRILAKNAISDKKTGKKFRKNELNKKIDWKSSFSLSELKKSKLIESKHYGYLNITNEGLKKIDSEK